MTTTTTIPSTLEAAVNALVESDVARYGETEREASRKLHGSKSLGMALSELASRAELDGAPNAKALRKAAKAAQTKADKALIRKGG